MAKLSRSKRKALREAERLGKLKSAPIPLPKSEEQSLPGEGVLSQASPSENLPLPQVTRSVKTDNRVRLSRTEIILLVIGTALGLASLPGSDPWIVVPMLVISESAFLWLFSIHSGSRSYRIFGALVVTVIFGGIGIRLYVDSLPPKATEKEQAKILVTNIESVLGGSLGPNDPPYSLINVTFTNIGDLPADEVAHNAAVMQTVKDINDVALREEQDQLLKADIYWTTQMDMAKGRELYKEGPATIFSMPYLSTDPIAKTIKEYFSSKQPNKRLYILVTLKYRDLHGRETARRDRTMRLDTGRF